MSTPVKTIEVDRSMIDAAISLMREDVSSLVVVDGGEAVGLITKTDVVDAVSQRGGDISGEKVETYISAPLHTTDAGTAIEDAIEKMQNERIKYLPVTEGRRPVGMVTATDMLRHNTDFIGEVLDLRLKRMDGL